MRYTVSDLRDDFPDENACLEWLVSWLYPDGITCTKCKEITKHYRMKSRKSYSCSQCGNHFHPTANTIFHKSRTPLRSWFHAMYLMSTNKAGTSAKQVERELGVTYKTAWRMMHQIRKLMEPSDDLFQNEVEIDETFVHPNVWKRSSARRRYLRNGRTGQVLFGIVQREGRVRIWHVKTAGSRVLNPIIHDNVAKGTLVHTDGYMAYRPLSKTGYTHRWTDHGGWEFYTPDSATQNIENVWSHLKRGIKGVYRHVSPKHLQKYANEFAWRYSYRKAVSMFWTLMGRVGRFQSI